MKTTDGREVLVTLALPLSLALAGDLMVAVGEVAQRHGYTDVMWLTDGSDGIVGTPPARRQEVTR